MDSAFGQLLRQWRGRRSLSQLALASKVEMSQRHLSFLERGMSRPRQAMVLRLSEALEIPLRERNQLLVAAGLPAVFPEHCAELRALAPFRGATTRMLAAHEPYPGIALNGRWDVVELNHAAEQLFPGLGGRTANMAEAIFADPLFRAATENWAEVAYMAYLRLEREASFCPSDARLQELKARAEAVVCAHRLGPSADAPEDLAICPTFMLEGQRVRTFVVVAQYSAARELRLDEARIELLYPADDDARAFFEARG